MQKVIDFYKKHTLIAPVIKLACFMILGFLSFFNEFEAVFRAIGFPSRYKSIKKYKNIHYGKRCFIVCTGPSLTIDDLELIKNEFTFGMNSIVRKYGETEFRPTYYGIQDINVYKEICDDILKYYRDKDNIFVKDRLARKCNVSKSWNIYPLNVAYHTYDRWFKRKYHVKFSGNAFRQVYDGYSITLSLMQLAIYMGFKEIYLLGADCCYSKDKPLHFGEYRVVDKNIDDSKIKSIVGHIEAKKYADTHDIKIYNATRGGELEVYPRVKLEKVLK